MILVEIRGAILGVVPKVVYSVVVVDDDDDDVDGDNEVLSNDVIGATELGNCSAIARNDGVSSSSWKSGRTLFPSKRNHNISKFSMEIKNTKNKQIISIITGKTSASQSSHTLPIVSFEFS